MPKKEEESSLAYISRITDILNSPDDIVSPELKTEAITELISKDKKFLQQSYNGFSILHLAIKHQLTKLADVLIRAEATLIKRSDKDGKTVIWYIIEYFVEDALNILQFLLKNDPLQAYEKITDEYPLQAAVRLKKAWAIAVLPKDGGILVLENEQGLSLFALASQDASLCEALLKFPTEITEERMKFFPSYRPQRVVAKKQESSDEKKAGPISLLDKLQKTADSLVVSHTEKKDAHNLKQTQQTTVHPSGSSSGSRRHTFFKEPLEVSSQKVASAGKDNSSNSSSKESRSQSKIITNAKTSFDLKAIITEANNELLADYFKQKGATNIEVDGIPLIIQAFKLATNTQVETGVDQSKQGRLRKQFFMLLEYSNLSTVDFEKTAELQINPDKKFDLLQAALFSLDAKRAELHLIYETKLFDLETEFEGHLYHSGLNERLTVSTYRIPQMIYDEQSDITLTTGLCAENKIALASLVLWNTCTIVSNPEAFAKITSVSSLRKKFDKDSISSLIIGLLEYIDTRLIIEILIGLYPHFDFTQRLIANFIVKELFMWDIHYELNSDPKMVSKLNASINRFCACNKEYMPGYSEELNTILLKFFSLNCDQCSQVAIVNFRIINGLIHNKAVGVTINSFDELIRKAAKNDEPDLEYKYIESLAHEFRSLSVYFFKVNSVKNNQLETIDKQLIFFLQELILTLPFIESARLLKLLIQVVNYLNQDHLTGPDLRTIGLIKIAIDSASTSSLIKRFVFITRDPLLNRSYLDLLELYDIHGNYKNISSLMNHSAKKILLPFFAPLLKNLALVEAGNSKSFFNLITLIGGMRVKFFRLRRDLLGMVCPPKTDVVLLVQRDGMSDDKQDVLSGELRPNDTPKDYFTLTFAETMVWLFDLNQHDVKQKKHRNKVKGELNLILSVSYLLYEKITMIEDKTKKQIEKEPQKLFEALIKLIEKFDLTKYVLSEKFKISKDELKQHNSTARKELLHKKITEWLVKIKKIVPIHRHSQDGSSEFPAAALASSDTPGGPENEKTSFARPATPSLPIPKIASDTQGNLAHSPLPMPPRP